jgi:hypothetical protein
VIAPEKIIVEHVTIEFFNEPRDFVVLNPVQSRVVLGGQPTQFNPQAIVRTDSCQHMLIVVCADEISHLKARRYCEEQLDKCIAKIAIMYSPKLLYQTVFRGCIIEPHTSVSQEYLVHAEDPISISQDLELQLAKICSSLGQDLDHEKRFVLMARFFAKSLHFDPSEEKFLLLWTILEIFPMKDTSNIKPISDYLGAYLNKPSDDVKGRLKIGRLFGFRSDLVHDGRLDVPPEDINSVFELLESICVEVLRALSGLPYTGSLNKYFAD